jgi:hypothetical protein
MSNAAPAPFLPIKGCASMTAYYGLPLSPPSDLEHSMFILHVDLWDETMTQEVNLVRSASATPSISSTSPASYTQLESSQAPNSGFQHIMPQRDAGYPGASYTQSHAMASYAGYPGGMLGLPSCVSNPPLPRGSSG